MSRTIDPGKGSKGKVRQVRWTRAEVVSAILLLPVLAAEDYLVVTYGSLLRLGGREDCPGHEHNQDPGNHSKQGPEDVGIGDATQRGCLGAGRNPFYAGGFRLLTRRNQAG